MSGPSPAQGRESDVCEPVAGSEDEIVRLWEEAWDTARRLCARTLARLERGDGGFYGAEDLRQDLFLEFWSLLGEWRAAPSPRAEDLWREWRRRLARGGYRVIRRRPQRLWDRAEGPVDPLVLMLDEPVDTGEDALGDRSVGPSAAAKLVQPEDALASHEALHSFDALEEALWELTPSQRQVVYMSALMDLPAKTVARCLGLTRREGVYAHLHEARRVLMARLER